METKSIIAWLFAFLLVSVGLANLILVHPVPGLAYLAISLMYFPPAATWLQNKTGIRIPALVKILLGIVLIMFTFGVSDLGDMID